MATCFFVVVFFRVFGYVVLYVVDIRGCRKACFTRDVRFIFLFVYVRLFFFVFWVEFFFKFEVFLVVCFLVLGTLGS